MLLIQPVTVSAWPSTETADRAVITNISINPDVVAAADIVLGAADAAGNFVAGSKSVQSRMTAEQYAAWGTDDSYAERTFLENIGLVLK